MTCVSFLVAVPDANVLDCASCCAVLPAVAVALVESIMASRFLLSVLLSLVALLFFKSF